MKTRLLFALLILAGNIAIAQTGAAGIDPPKLLIGKWLVLQENPYEEPKSISFYADGMINLDDATSKLLQRYKVSKAAKGYKVEVLEVINGKPLSSFNILPLNEEEMQLSYGDAPQLSYKRLKRFGD